MNRKHPDVVMTEMVEKCLDTLVNKAKEYSMDSDRLHNFRVAAALQDCRMRRSLYGMMVKHITSIADMCCSDKDYSLEMWEEKIQDNINYLLLLRAIIEEEMTEFDDLDPCVFISGDQYFIADNEDYDYLYNEIDNECDCNCDCGNCGCCTAIYSAAEIITEDEWEEVEEVDPVSLRTKLLTIKPENKIEFTFDKSVLATFDKEEQDYIINRIVDALKSHFPKN